MKEKTGRGQEIVSWPGPHLWKSCSPSVDDLPVLSNPPRRVKVPGPVLEQCRQSSEAPSFLRLNADLPVSDPLWEAIEAEREGKGTGAEFFTAEYANVRGDMFREPTAVRSSRLLKLAALSRDAATHLELLTYPSLLLLCWQMCRHCDWLEIRKPRTRSIASPCRRQKQARRTCLSALSGLAFAR